MRVKPLDYYSKYVYNYYCSKAEDLVKMLIEKCVDKDHKPIVFPLDDASVYIIDQSLSRLKDYFLFANVENKDGAVSRLMNKSVQRRIATKAGLNVAKGWEIPYVNGEYVIPEDIEYPCFLKGELCFATLKKFQKKCNDEKELRSVLDESRESFLNPFPFIAEEYLKIDEEIGFMGISDGDNSRIPIMVEKIENGKGTTNGVTMLARLFFMEDDNEITTSLSRFLSELNYFGITNFDLAVCNGKLYFLEVNFRYAAYGYAACLAGINLPEMFVKLITGECIQSSNENTNVNKLFFNEKVGARSILERFISWKKYREMDKMADYKAIKSKDDPRPYYHFLIQYFLRYIRTRLLG